MSLDRRTFLLTGSAPSRAPRPLPALSPKHGRCVMWNAEAGEVL